MLKRVQHDVVLTNTELLFVYYLRDKLVRGVLLWNVWDKVPTARELIASPLERSDVEMKGLIES